MTRAALLVLAGLIVAAPALGRPVEPACRGKVSGSVSGAFECTFHVAVVNDATLAFEIRPTGTMPGVPAYAPGAFQVSRPVKPGVYTLDTLGMGRASVADDDKTLFTATKTSGQRGEVKLTVTAVERGPGGLERLHGTYWARLIPAGAGKPGEVIVDVTF